MGAAVRCENFGITLRLPDVTTYLFDLRHSRGTLKSRTIVARDGRGHTSSTDPAIVKTFQSKLRCGGTMVAVFRSSVVDRADRVVVCLRVRFVLGIA